VTSSARRVALRAVETASLLLARAQIAGVRATTSTGDRVVVLDIDNTLADAWPSFLRPFDSHRGRLAGLEVLPNIKAVAHDAPLAAGATIVYLSHRNLWEWWVTYRWLRRHGFSVRADRLVLVPSAPAKVPLLRRLAEGRDVTVWDDLSYGHESGEISFYSDVIDLLAGVSLTHRSWADIVATTGRGLDRPPSGRD